MNPRANDPRVLLTHLRVLLAGILAHTGVALAEDIVPMDAQQIEGLGIEVASPIVEVASVGIAVPARVMIPPAQVQVISAPVSGLVSHMALAVGEPVAAGDVVAVMESAELVTIQRDYLRARTALRLAQQRRDRDRLLFKEGIIAESRLQVAEAEYQEKRADVDEGRRLLTLGGMDDAAIKALETSTTLTPRLEVKAASAGSVLERMETAGGRVEAQAPLYRTAKLDPLWLELTLPQERLAEVSVGTSITVPDSQVEARVIHVGRVIDPDSQGVLVRAEVTAGAERLLPGQYVNVRARQAGAGAVSVPVGAVVRSAGETFVFVRAPQGFVVRPVTTAGRAGERIWVAEGLTASDRIAVKGAAALKAAWMGMSGGE
jgi:cobalt-zinc-cadmium efflux system membrane fusion protein